MNVSSSDASTLLRIHIPRPLEEITNHNSFYFENGDIVILSLPTDNVITAFKVDKAFLSRGSSVFESMLSIPAPETVSTYEGVPFVQLHDDAISLEQLFAALYGRSVIPTTRHATDTPKKVERILTLANKYQFDALRDRIVTMLEADWPSDLVRWDANEAELASLRHNDDDKNRLFSQDAAEFIRLGRICGVPSILPAAFYRASCISPYADKNNNLVDRPVIDGGIARVLSGREMDSSHLNYDDLFRLTQGKELIRDYMATFCSKMIMLMPILCRRSCIRAREGRIKGQIECERCTQESLRILIQEILENRDALELLNGNASGTGACAGCSRPWRQLVSEARAEMWDQLPVFFGLRKETGSITCTS